MKTACERCERVEYSSNLREWGKIYNGRTSDVYALCDECYDKFLDFMSGDEDKQDAQKVTGALAGKEGQ